MRILREHCSALGRNPDEVEVTVSFPMLLRNTASAAQTAFIAQMRHNGNADIGNVPLLLCPPRAAADAMRPYLDLGARTFVARLLAPFDQETIERIGEVREALA